VEGGKILTFGILSIFCCPIIFGWMALSQGINALQIIDSGRADPKQRPLVLGGAICGGVGLVLAVLTFIVRMYLIFNQPHY
jgi:uncharacterized membrane protein HdeD (DUF308 family)